MKIVLQRVSEASVTVDEKVIGEIGRGFLLLLGIEQADEESDIEWLVNKISKMRLFEDREGVMNFSLQEVDGDALVVSQFTLHASTKKGNRPSYIKAARPEQAVCFYEQFCEKLAEEIPGKLATGRFGAEMKVSLVNDGPVTIVIDSRNRV